MILSLLRKLENIPQAVGALEFARSKRQKAMFQFLHYVVVVGPSWLCTRLPRELSVPVLVVSFL